jgi:uridine kinase
MTNKPFIIGIAGGSASGKSFVVDLLKMYFSWEVTFISQDDFYKDISKIPLDKNNNPNFDLPQCIDWGNLYNTLTLLQNGLSASGPKYHFGRIDLPEEKIEYPVRAVIVLEGLFIFDNPSISDLLDYKILIDAREEVKISRRMKRDVDDRGLNPTQVIYQWENHVWPAYKRFLLPYKDECDIIINNNGSNNLQKSIDMLTEFILKKVKQAFA